MSDAYGSPTNVPAVLPPAVFDAVNAMNLARDLGEDASGPEQAVADAVAAAVAAHQLDPGAAAALVAAYGVRATPTPAQQPS